MKYSKENKDLVQSLLIIRNKGVCEYTHWRAVQEFIKIKFRLACGHLTTREAGNKLFNESKKGHDIKRITAKGEVVDLDEEIKYYEDAVDPYTCYIDSYKQEQEAIRNNERLWAIIDALKRKEKAYIRECPEEASLLKLANQLEEYIKEDLLVNN